LNAARVLIGAHVLSMLGFATYAALLPDLRDLWGMSNTEAGMIGSAFFAGYIATVSYWTALTDRVDGRRIYAVGSMLAFVGAAFDLALDLAGRTDSPRPMKTKQERSTFSAKSAFSERNPYPG